MLLANTLVCPRSASDWSCTAAIPIHRIFYFHGVCASKFPPSVSTTLSETRDTIFSTQSPPCQASVLQSRSIARIRRTCGTCIQYYSTVRCTLKTFDCSVHKRVAHPVHLTSVTSYIMAIIWVQALLQITTSSLTLARMRLITCVSNDCIPLR